MAKKVEQKAKHGGQRIPSKDNLYAYASKFSREAIAILMDLARNGKYEAVRMGAAGKLLDKCLADLKASEVAVSGDIRVHVVEDKQNNNNE